MNNFELLPINELMRPEGFECECGRHHAVSCKYLSIRRGAIKDLTAAVRAVGGAKPLLVCDKNTWKAAGERAFDLLKAGCTLSFGAGLLRDAGTMDYFAEIPLDRILIETDESPELFGRILAEAAAMHLLPPSEFAAAVRANFERIFRHGLA